MNAVHIRIRGTVQGVGFRPFVYRLAHDCAIKGWIQNSPQGVVLEVEGPRVDEFIHRLCKEQPPYCVIQELMQEEIGFKGYKNFEIVASDEEGEQTALVLPDIATCAQCLEEIFNPHDRRYLYPFTNCTHCGPRYSIIEDLPYDRAHTSMKYFKMCPACQKEYDDPLNRRFHAQPNACPVCGPKVELWDNRGHVISDHDLVKETAKRLKQGAIVAVKGLGGFHLMVDACNEKAVEVLRERKQRPHKPLAVMFASIEAIHKACVVSDLEKQLLVSGQSPIVLVRQKTDERPIAPSVAPGNPYLGVMLPCMPLQHILMRYFGGPLVATSGNLSDEPVCIDNQEARQRLGGIADYFLTHNRPIVRQVDDSVVHEMANQPYFLRRSRGFAPLPVGKLGVSKGVLAVGAHQKNTVALTVGQGAVVSQHIGDLETTEFIDAFKRTIESLHRIYASPIEHVVCDLHPDYTSSAYAKDLKVALTQVQHHQAHVAACMAEKNLQSPVLGICFDGTGYGLDHTIWGGEFLKFDGQRFQRVGHLKLFPLPGGEAAVHEPRRSALGLLSTLGEPLDFFGDLDCMRSFTKKELKIIERMLEKKINCPETSSMGRLFDGISSLIGLCHVTSFEGQAAMALEFAAEPISVLTGYPYSLVPHPTYWTVDWSGMVRQVVEDVRRGLSAAQIAAKFHYTIVEIMVSMARCIGESKVILSGGCFQNKLLTNNAIACLQEEGFEPLWHTEVPCNDGGIALGQLWIALNLGKQGEKICA